MAAAAAAAAGARLGHAGPGRRHGQWCCNYVAREEALEEDAQGTAAAAIAAAAPTRQRQRSRMRPRTKIWLAGWQSLASAWIGFL